MNIPAAARQNFEQFKLQGTLGVGAEHNQIPLEQAAILDQFSSSIDEAVASDNQDGVDTNPNIGELRLEDEDFIRDVTVNGDSSQGTLAEVALAKEHDLQSVILMEASGAEFISYQAYLDKAGSLTHAWAYVVDRNDPSKTYSESYQPNSNRSAN